MASSVQAVAAEVLNWRTQGRFHRVADRLATEEPLEIRVRGRPIAVTMRTPGHDAELAAGFFFTEGLIRTCADVLEIAPCQRGAAPENTLNVFLAPSIRVNYGRMTRHVFTSSSCGLCGKASIDAVHQHFAPVESQITIGSTHLLELPKRLRAAQKAFDQTGGLHAAAIFDVTGRPIVVREDVGRHNAVDKVIGYGFLRRKLPFDRQILMVSGRASFEIMQKALAARIPIVCAVSAPSSLAVEFAQESGQTLVGFLRVESFNLYSHPERIQPDSQRQRLKTRDERINRGR